jgi:hypothetical protein
MAARLLRIEAAAHSHLVMCGCGYRTIRCSRPAALAAADQHRQAEHPAAVRDRNKKRRSRWTA